MARSTAAGGDRLDAEQVEARRFCIEYVRIISYGLPFFGLMMVGGMCMYGAGESIRPSVIAFVVNIVNVVMSWILSGADFAWGTVGLDNPFKWDLFVEGIAWGSTISFVVGGLLTLFVLFGGIGTSGCDWPRCGCTGRWLGVIRIGLPNFLEGCSMWAANIVVLWMIGRIAASEMEQAAGVQVRCRMRATACRGRTSLPCSGRRSASCPGLPSAWRQARSQGSFSGPAMSAWLVVPSGHALVWACCSWACVGSV